MKHEAIKNRFEGMLPAFDRYIGIDYSGAETPISSLNGLRVYPADRLSTPEEVYPPRSPLRDADNNGSLAKFFKPELTPPEQAIAQFEGWILGIK